MAAPLAPPLSAATAAQAAALLDAHFPDQPAGAVWAVEPAVLRSDPHHPQGRLVLATGGLFFVCGRVRFGARSHVYAKPS